MTLFSEDDNPVIKDLGASLEASLDKQQNGFEIEVLVNEYELTYLEATTHWLEENSIPESQFARFIPVVIIDKIRAEAVIENMLRPSMSRTQSSSSLDFLL